MVQGADIDCPILVTPRGFERQRLLFGTRVAVTARAQAVELAIECENPTTGPGAQLDAQLLERRMHSKLPKFWILLELPYRLQGVQVDLQGALAPSMRLIDESGEELGFPPRQDLVDRRATHLQIADSRQCG